MSVRQELPGVHPAFPVAHKTMLHSEWNGLTKREYIAATLLSGLLAQRATRAKRFHSLAATAIRHADDLLEQLQEAPV